MQLAHKIELKPSKQQIQLLNKACGCARFTYNWALNKWQEMYHAFKLDNSLPKPNANTIKKEFNRIKKTEFSWIYESPKDANQQMKAMLRNSRSLLSFFCLISIYKNRKKVKIPI